MYGLLQLDTLKKEYQKEKNDLYSYYTNQIKIIQNNTINNKLAKKFNRHKNMLIKSLTLYYNNNNKFINFKYNNLIQYYNQEQKILNNNNIKALMVGINYNNTDHQLNGCINDVNNLKKYLIQKHKLQNKVCILTDNTPLKPTKTIILKKYKDLLTNSKSGDTIFFTYSGHGSYINDLNGDELDGKDELLVSIDNYKITDDELKEITDKYLPNNVRLFLLFDCCHSGTLMDLKYNYLSKTNYNEIVTNDSLETKSNVYLISGCRDNQTSMEAYIKRKIQGAMTHAFLNVIKQNKNLSWKTLLLKMRDQLSKKFTQVPQLSAGKNININDKIFV